LFEEGEKVFRKRRSWWRWFVGILEDVIEEFIREGGEVVESRGLRRVTRSTQPREAWAECKGLA